MTGVVLQSIQPKAMLQVAPIRLAMLNALRKAGTQVKKDFAQTTTTWKHKVTFESLISAAQNKLTLVVDTNDKIWGYVDQGTKPHDIWAGFYTGKSKKKTLAFASVWSPKTKPGSLSSGQGTRGATNTFRPYVRHPGTKARGFSSMITKRRTLWFQVTMLKALQEAAKKSGYAMK